MEFKTIESQEELDKIIKERIDRERRTIKEKYADYDELKNAKTKLEAEYSGMQEKLNEANEKIKSHDNIVSELNTKIKGYETASTKTRIALEVGLPYEMAGRLTGDDEETIRQDAESLKQMMGTKVSAPLHSKEGTIEAKTRAFKNLLNDLKGE